MRIKVLEKSIFARLVKKFSHFKAQYSVHKNPPSISKEGHKIPNNQHGKHVYSDP